ncbi:hypothetical protein F4678DRAFT_353265 [Xylaria arbuscula]|nr:hypothetical protein F4678DRAFT_353265 [Xylaria arbuscula]
MIYIIFTVLFWTVCPLPAPIPSLRDPCSYKVTAGEITVPMYLDPLTLLRLALGYLGTYRYEGGDGGIPAESRLGGYRSLAAWIGWLATRGHPINIRSSLARSPCLSSKPYQLATYPPHTLNRES